jgi:hypothetical protein
VSDNIDAFQLDAFQDDAFQDGEPNARWTDRSNAVDPVWTVDN